MKIPLTNMHTLNGGDGISFIEKTKEKYNRDKVVKESAKLFDIDQHDIKKKADKQKVEVLPSIAKDADGIPIPNIKTSFVEVSKTPLDIANYIIEQKATLVTGAGVGLDAEDTESELYKKVKLNWDNSKFEYDLSKVFKTLKTETQVAIILFGKPNSSEYGYKLASPNRGDLLIPFFDEETEDFVGMQREYKIGADTIVDLYYKSVQGTPRLKRVKNNIEVEDNELPYHNLPIIYFEQDENECANIAELIYSLEEAMNTFIDTARYYADPILFSKGSDINLPAQTDSGKLFISKDEHGDMKFITPENPTEMRRLHFEMLEKYIFLLSHSVRLDAESLQGLGKSGLSGEAIERLMTDAYMYATNEQNGEFGKGVQRLVNWLTKEHTTLSRNAEQMNIKAKFRKYSLRGEQERVELFMKANGNLPIIGHEESIVSAGLAKDVDFMTETV